MSTCNWRVAPVGHGIHEPARKRVKRCSAHATLFCSLHAKGYATYLSGSSFSGSLASKASVDADLVTLKPHLAGAVHDLVSQLHRGHIRIGGHVAVLRKVVKKVLQLDATV